MDPKTSQNLGLEFALTFAFVLGGIASMIFCGVMAAMSLLGWN